MKRKKLLQIMRRAAAREMNSEMGSIAKHGWTLARKWRILATIGGAVSVIEGIALLLFII